MSFEIAHIQLVFDQSTLIDLLTTRGFAMLDSSVATDGGNLAKYNKKINEYVNSTKGNK
jgi:hypothetical protein